MTSPRGNCVPPCRATASPSHRTRPPLWAYGPPTALRRSAPPAEHLENEISTGIVATGEEKRGVKLRRMGQARPAEPWARGRLGLRGYRGLWGGLDAHLTRHRLELPVLAAQAADCHHHRMSMNTPRGDTHRLAHRPLFIPWSTGSTVSTLGARRAQ